MIFSVILKSLSLFADERRLDNRVLVSFMIADFGHNVNINGQNLYRLNASGEWAELIQLVLVERELCSTLMW